MKLVVCLDCSDVFKMTTGKSRSCRCGQSRGWYHDDGWHTTVQGANLKVMGVGNGSVVNAIRMTSAYPTKSHDIKAWVFSNTGEDAARIAYDRSPIRSDTPLPDPLTGTTPQPKKEDHGRCQTN